MPEHVYDPGVPFPRTVPEGAPQAEEAALDWRAAHLFYEEQQERRDAIGYRMTSEGVVLTHAPATTGRESPQSVHSWDEVKRVARQRRDSGADTELRRR
jgi:hypothetical protein